MPILSLKYTDAGTTWIKALTYAVMSRSQHPPSDPHHPLLRLNPHDCVHFLEKMFNDGRGSEVDSLPSPRILSTHLPYSMLPDSIASLDDCRIVYVCRDPKDVLVFGWHFGKKLLGPACYGQSNTFDEAAMASFDGRNKVANYGEIWDHVLGYWRESRRKPEKVLFLSYEEMMEEPEASLKTLAAFVGCPFSPKEEKEGVVKEIVRLCSFKNLSNLAVNKPPSGDVSDEGKRSINYSFFRKGETGDWRNLMSPDVARRIDEITTKKFQGSGLSLTST